ncbi:hypothetical protein ABOM_010441 [Aspergillus bombycis]|uniref:Methyltransferase domain-containing protein n=1 Tax=Aspergillus bombycis TaxID=109264 RepID=A0A1F7ZNU1_9EURO|nr:hypothetical protein ABOM_010441 [Aspergillus bombycis]OGM41102.1 hypothetical protein ABOM_010441 [Aspergillus bombycis]
MPRVDFGTKAADYAAIAHQVSRNIASAALKHTPQLAPSSHVLDLACGSGEVTSVLMENAAAQGDQQLPTIIGLDIAPEMVQLYKERAETNAWTTVSAQVQDAQDLGEFTDAQFDLVFMSFGLMYVPDPARCTREVFRVLKPGGHAVFTTWKEAAVPRLLAQATAAASCSCFTQPTDGAWGTKEKLVSTVKDGGFATHNIQVVVEETKFDRGNGDGIAEALSRPSWNPLHDGTSEATLKWQSILREQMTPTQRENGTLDMISWVCIARKNMQ